MDIEIVENENLLAFFKRIIMDKIAFVVVRYGEEINGGAEFHCRMLAERLTDRYQVEVLTTCVKDYTTGDNEFPEGEERINGVLVHRFAANPIKKEQLRTYARKSKLARKLRRFLSQIHLQAPMSYFVPIWTYWRKYEIKALNSNVFYSSTMFSFIKEHKDEYKVFIPISLDYPQVYYTSLYAPEKTLLIPTMHNQNNSFRSILTDVFTKVAYIGFNTTAEEKLAKRIFGSRMSRHGIVSVGIDMAVPADWETTSNKYQLPEEYLLYVGRVDTTKLRHIIKYFINYKKRYKESNLKLVLVGGMYTKPFIHPDIIYTGFVDEHEKAAIIQHSKIVVNPSKYESLSLILLEAMNMKKALLVNGFCNVLREHCRKSNQAAFAYYFEISFIYLLHKLDFSDELRTKMGEKGAEYVKRNYDWNLILERLTNAIELVGKRKTNS